MMYILFVVFGLILLFNNIEANSFGGRIINGTNAELGEFPYIVSYRALYGKHTCGGTIINENFILTAAQCVHYFTSETIQHGVVDISVNGSNIIPIMAAYSIVHEKYNSRTKENDIALLFLRNRIKFDKYTQPVVLPQQNEVFPELSTAIMAGWGSTDEESGFVSSLKKVTLQTYNYMSCNETYKTNIFETSICAGVPGGLKGACYGDGGGPLMVNGVQVGIGSWSMKPCGAPLYPGVYTRVSSYVDWINSEISPLL